MQFTRATDYAVRVMVQLALLPRGEKKALPALVRASGVRSSFLSKVLQKLVCAGLLSSQRGRGGGFCLRSASGSTTLLAVVEAIEGPLKLNVCTDSGQGCSRQTWCGIHPFWEKAQNALCEVLDSVTIAELAQQSATNVLIESVRVDRGDGG